MIPKWNITDNGEYLSDLAISDDGSRLITGSVTGIATVYDQSGAVVWKTQVPGSLLVGCQGNGSAFILGSRDNIYTNKGAIRSYDGNGSELWYANTGCIAVLGMAGKNNRVVTGNMAGELIVLGDAGQEVARFNDFPKTKIVADISVADNGKVFSYALHEMYPQVRYVTVDTKKKSLFKGLFNGSSPGYGGTKPIGDIAMSPDGKYIAVASGEGSRGTFCLHANNGTLIWSKDMDEIKDTAITANGSSVFVGTGKGDIFGYNRSGNLSWVYSSGSPVTSFSLAKDNNLLSVGNSEGNVYLFNETGTLLWTNVIEEFPVGQISQVELSRDGTALAVLVNKKNVYYFENKPEPVVGETSEVTGIPAPPPLQESMVDVQISPASCFLQWTTRGIWNVTTPLKFLIPKNQGSDSGTSSSSWLAGWQNRKTHSISGSSAGDQVNYQMKFVIHRMTGSDSGQDVFIGENGCLPDYADIRFFADTSDTQLDYWIESNNISIAVIWVEIPFIPSNGTDIRMYYGNDAATGESNGNATFLFFDHFDGTNLDTGKWNVSGSPDISGSVIELNTTKGNVYIVSKTAWPVNTSYTSYGIMNDTINNTYQGYFNNSGDYLLFWPSNPNLRATNRDNKTQTTSLGGEYDGWTRYEIIRNAVNSVVYRINDTSCATHSTSTAISPDPIRIILKGTINSQYWIDYLFVRSYVSPEPTHSNWSVQESSPLVLSD